MRSYEKGCTFLTLHSTTGIVNIYVAGIGFRYYFSETANGSIVEPLLYWLPFLLQGLKKHTKCPITEGVPILGVAVTKSFTVDLRTKCALYLF